MGIRVLLVVLLCLAGLLGLAATITEAQPLVAEASPPTPYAVARARMLFHVHDPRRLAPGQQGDIRLAQPEVDLALAALPQLAPARFGIPAAHAQLRLGEKSAELAVTWRLPRNPLGDYLNLRTTLENNDQGLVPRHTRLGPVPVPDALAAFLVGRAQAALASHPEWGPMATAIESAAIQRGRLRLRYRVPDNLAQRLGGLALGASEAAALEPLHTALALALTAAPPTVSLAALLPPLFQAAEAQGGGVEAWRATFLLLGSHFAGHSLARFVPEAETWPALPHRTVTLASRVDSAQHFAVSAVISLHAGTPVANAVGVWKELSDSRRGSGFSFADLAADVAGTRLGQALDDDGEAMAQRLARGVSEADLIPVIADLPEQLSAAEFRARYGNTQDPRYQEMTAEIDRRVAALPLYR